MFTSFFRGFMEVLNLQLKRIKDLRFQLILGTHKFSQKIVNSYNFSFIQIWFLKITFLIAEHSSEFFVLVVRDAVDVDTKLDGEEELLRFVFLHFYILRNKFKMYMLFAINTSILCFNTYNFSFLVD